MKTCPNCGELIGDGVDECFNCHYSFSLGRVITNQDKEKVRLNEEKKHQAKLEQEKRDQQILECELQKNSRYEYEVETLIDDASGSINTHVLKETLGKYAAEGWRLKSVFTDEIGKNSDSSGVGGVSSGTNATIEQVIMIFERCIYHGND